MEYPCTRAMVSDVAMIKPDQTVEEALEIFKERSIRNIPVVDESGKFLGLFGLHQVLLSLLPKAATMQGGLESLNFVVDAAPGIAKRLKKLYPVHVSEIMNKKPNVAYCETSTIEALHIMATKGSPVAVIDKVSSDFKGMISRKTLLENFYSLLEEIEQESVKTE